MIRSVGVFCGSGVGKREIYSEKAAAMGRLLSHKQISMVYGGGNIGLMGVIADSMIQSGGHIIGVITEKLVEVELAHAGINELKIVPSMSERKNLIIDICDAFIIMPGGLGTFDELFEVLTLCQLNHIKKPVGLYNVEGYFEPFIKLIRHCIEERFVREEHAGLFITDEDEVSLLDKLGKHQPPETLKWLENFKDNKF
jgi:uncharacterized protein (TIGR00730 family)